MSVEENKALVRSLIDDVWRNGRLDRLPLYWSQDCVNHADPSPQNAGLGALRNYHEQFAGAFAAFSDMAIDVSQQIAEGDRVVTQIATRGKHTGDFRGVPPTGRVATLATIGIDRIHGGKIAEHWSVADMAGLINQLSP